ncbi:hypothetical protein Tco_1534152, partial [Tanacetum coccineum]
NVSLNVEDRSAGGSCKTTDMEDFQKCIEDIICTGIHFTWVQSRLNASSGILKKIDMIMGNCRFMDNFSNAHAIFLPHLTSHSPCILIIPHTIKNKKGAFKFTNYIADMPEFIGIVKKEWINQLSWKEGNLYESYYLGSPIKIDLGWGSFLCQQAKIDWLKDGEKNNKLFHSVLKGRKHRARIAMINDEKGNLLEGMNVPKQFVLHFHKFLGTSEPVQQFDTSNLRHVAKVTLKEVNYMVRNVSDEETKQTMCYRYDNKGRGSYISLSFYFGNGNIQSYSKSKD